MALKYSHLPSEIGAVSEKEKKKAIYLRWSQICKVHEFEGILWVKYKQMMFCKSSPNDKLRGMCECLVIIYSL